MIIQSVLLDDALPVVVEVLVVVVEVLPSRLDRTFLNSDSKNDKDTKRPPERKAKMIMWIRAKLTMAPAIVSTSKRPMTKRTKGSNITPPPGCIICETKEEDIVSDYLCCGKGEHGIVRQRLVSNHTAC